MMTNKQRDRNRFFSIKGLPEWLLIKARKKEMILLFNGNQVLLFTALFWAILPFAVFVIVLSIHFLQKLFSRN